MERQPRPRLAVAGRMAYRPGAVTEIRRGRGTRNRQRASHRSSDLSRKERPVRASIIKAAGLQASGAHGSHAVHKAPPANAALARYSAVKAAQAGPPAGAASPARPAPATSPSATAAAPDIPSSVNALPSPVSGQP